MCERADEGLSHVHPDISKAWPRIHVLSGSCTFLCALIYSFLSFYSTFCSFDIISRPNVRSHLPTSHCCGSAVCLSEGTQWVCSWTFCTFFLSMLFSPFIIWLKLNGLQKYVRTRLSFVYSVVGRSVIISYPKYLRSKLDFVAFDLNKMGGA